MMKLYKEDNPNESLEYLLGDFMFKETVTKKNIINVSAAFDTEASSFFDKQGEPVGLIYVWMLGINTRVVYGRELYEFQHLIQYLNGYLKNKNKKLIIYIHNMKYDFQFIKNYFDWDKVFSKSKRNILFADIGNIEFRDSLILAGGRSLAYIGKNLKTPGFNKMTGDLNYELIRHPKTHLTGKELKYCEMDVRVLCKYIDEKIKEDGDISKIPYTNTGYVRNYVRNACFTNGNREKYLQLMDTLTMTPGCYQQSEKAFIGGAVGANLTKINRVVRNVTSYDIKSSYPYVMCTGYYPMSLGEPVKNNKAKEILLNDKRHCMQFTLEIFGLVPKEGNNYCFPISESKCDVVYGAKVSDGNLNPDNIFDTYRVGSGRVISAMYVKTTCTELDFFTYRKFYDLDNCDWRVSSMRIFKKGWLPTPIIKSVLTFFKNKTELDGVEGKEAEYMISKNMLNAIYGMMVEKPVRPDFDYYNGIITKSNPDYVDSVMGYNNKWNRFLYYPWGVWVTAQARYRLYDSIAAVGRDFVYCDTDSNKFENAQQHENYFALENEKAKNNMIELSRRLGLSRSDVIPKSPNGEEKILGVWEKEWTAQRFKTLGAKRYLVEFQNGECLLTVAGSNKEQTLYYLINEQFFNGKEMFKNFHPKLVVPKEYSKRLVATFIEDEREGIVTDYMGVPYQYHVLSGIHMAPSDYSFSIPEMTRKSVEFLSGERWEDEKEI